MSSLMQVAFYFQFALPLLYISAVVSAYKFKWRWFCAALLILFDLVFMGWFVVIVVMGVFGWWQKALLLMTPVWGYVLLAAVAALSSRVSLTNVLMVAAHVLLVIGVLAWGLKPETVWLGVLFLLGAPIWLGIRLSRPRPVSIPSGDGVTLGR